MGINVALVRWLLVVTAGSTALLVIALGLAIPVRASVVPAGVVAVAASAWFAAGIWLWVYWLVHFKRSRQKREFWLCYLLPYGYALYRSVGAARETSRHDA